MFPEYLPGLADIHPSESFGKRPRDADRVTKRLSAFREWYQLRALSHGRIPSERQRKADDHSRGSGASVNAQRYLRFLFACASDPRFTSSNVLEPRYLYTVRGVGVRLAEPAEADASAAARADPATTSLVLIAFLVPIALLLRSERRNGRSRRDAAGAVAGPVVPELTDGSLPRTGRARCSSPTPRDRSPGPADAVGRAGATGRAFTAHTGRPSRCSCRAER